MRAFRVVIVVSVAETLGFFKGLINHVCRSGLWDVSCVTSPNRSLASISSQLGCPVSAIKINRSITPLSDVWAIIRLSWMLFESQVDVVHGNTPKGGLISMIAAYLVRTPARIYQIHGLPLVTARGLNRALLSVVEWFSCVLSTDVLSVGHGVRQAALDAGLVSPKKIVVLGNGSVSGVDSRERFNPEMVSHAAVQRLRTALGIGNQDFVVLYVGRLTEDKGVTVLLNCWSEVQRKVPDAHLVIVGENDSRKPLPPASLSIHQQNPRIHFTGHCADPRPAYSLSSVVVLPTFREGLPYVPLEAAAMAKAVVATDIPGCREVVVHGWTGILVPPADERALSAAIVRYAADRQLLLRHGRSGRDWVGKNFDESDTCKTVLEFYIKVMNLRRRELVV